MYTIGINTFLFASPFTDEQVSLFPMFKKWGFDAVELAIEDPSHINPAVVRKALDENGLTCCSVCVAMGPGRDLRGTEEEQQVSLTYQKAILDMMPELGCPVLIGPLYSVVGRADAEDEKQKEIQKEKVVKNLGILARYAADRGLLLAIEPLNRFETDMVNTCEQALEIVNAVNHPALTIHLDTFHMNIEEKNAAKAILLAGKHLGHFHACGSDRGTPGGDHIDWAPIKDALKKVDYKGSVVIESFTQDVKVIAKAAAIWRKIEKSQEEIASEGVKFLKKLFK